jgi:hypothetical protein
LQFFLTNRTVADFLSLGFQLALDLLGKNFHRRLSLLVAVQFDVALGCFTRVMRRMQMMPMGSMRMMRRHFVFASSMMLRRFAMVLRGVFMVFSSFRMMFFKFFWHRISFFLF